MLSRSSEQLETLAYSAPIKTSKWFYQNDPKITKSLMRTRTFHRETYSYDTIILLILLFAWAGCAFAWIYMHHSWIALVADIIYSIGVLGGTYGYLFSDYNGFIVLFAAFCIDTLFEIAGLVYINNPKNDLALIVGPKYRNMSRPLLLSIFAIYAAVQIVCMIYLFQIFMDLMELNHFVEGERVDLRKFGQQKQYVVAGMTV